jgi:hypothetical protein
MRTRISRVRSLIDAVMREEFFDSLPIRQSGARTKQVHEPNVREYGKDFPGPLNVHNDETATGTKNAPHFCKDRHLHRRGKVVKHQRAEHHQSHG